MVSKHYIVLVIVLLLCACGGDGVRLSGRGEDPCLQAIPACPGVTAACTLDPLSYSRVTFPGAFNFLVDLKPNSDLEVLMYFAQPRQPGLDTQIYWHEPGCSSLPQTYRSEGANLFEAGGGTGVFSQKRSLVRKGEHLIEIFSDMDADVFVTVEIHAK